MWAFLAAFQSLHGVSVVHKINPSQSLAWFLLCNKSALCLDLMLQYGNTFSGYCAMAASQALIFAFLVLHECH